MKGVFKLAVPPGVVRLSYWDGTEDPERWAGTGDLSIRRTCVLGGGCGEASFGLVVDGGVALGLVAGGLGLGFGPEVPIAWLREGWANSWWR